MTLDMNYVNGATQLVFSHADTRGRPYSPEVIQTGEEILRRGVEKHAKTHYDKWRAKNPDSGITEYSIKIPSSPATYFKVEAYFAHKFRENPVTANVEQSANFENAHNARSQKPNPQLKSDGLQGRVQSALQSVAQFFHLG